MLSDGLNLRAVANKYQLTTVRVGKNLNAFRIDLWPLKETFSWFPS